MKLAPLYGAFRRLLPEVEIDLIHSGQHYSDNMSKAFQESFHLPEPKVNFGISGGDNEQQVNAIVKAYEQYLSTKRNPEWVFVVGDVNATMACTLVASQRNIPVAHVEAGLRSFDKSMPEELNRTLTDQMSNLFFVTEPSAVENLKMEGIPANRIHLVGNIMIDALMISMNQAKASSVLRDLSVETGGFILFSAHRPTNVDTEEDLRQILQVIRTASTYSTVVFPVHPRTLKSLKRFGLLQMLKMKSNVILSNPLSHADFLNLLMNCACVLTDSGGIQEESSYLNIPCLTLRLNTERPLTIAQGSNVLVDKYDIVFLKKQLEHIFEGTWKTSNLPDYWDGVTASRIVEIFKGQIIKE